jgi:hypothetical protein
MAEIICLESHKHRKAAERGFREWRRIFRSIADFDEHTRWADLPDEIILFFCEAGPESKHAFYDLLMRSHHLGNGHDFETQDFDRLTILMNANFSSTTRRDSSACDGRDGWQGSRARTSPSSKW